MKTALSDDEQAVAAATKWLRTKGWITSDVPLEDLQQEMRLMMLRKPGPHPVGYKFNQCKGAVIDYLRKLKGRGKPIPLVFLDDEDMPDVSGGDDPVLWAEVAQAIDLASRPQKKATRVAAPDPRSLEFVDMPLPSRKKYSGPPSQWRVHFDLLEPGGRGIALTTAQAVAFARWARGAKLKVCRRKHDGITTHVWRPTETS